MADREDRLLAAVYRTWGKAAVYVEGGVSTPCTIVFIERGNPRSRSPFEGVTFHGVQLGLAMTEIDILVRVSEVGLPTTDGVFTLTDASGAPTGASWPVGDAPQYGDVEFREWRCPTSTPAA